MTISSETNRLQFSGGGTTGPFNITNLEIQNDDQVLVTLTGTDGSLSTLTKTTEYTINTDLDEVTTVSAVAVGETLTVTLNVPTTQGVDYKNTGTFDAEVNEDALDKLTLINKQLTEEIARSVKLQVDSTATDVTVPDASSGKALLWGTDGNLTNSTNNFNDIVTLAESDLSAVEADLASVEADTSSVSADLILTEADVSAAEADLSAVESDLASISGDLALAEADLAAVESDLVLTEADLTATEADSAAIAGDLAATEADLTAVEADAGQVATDLLATEADLAATEADLTATEADIVTTAADVTTVEADLAATEADLLAAETDASAVETDLAAVEADVASVNPALIITDIFTGDGVTVNFTLSQTVANDNVNAIDVTVGGVTISPQTYSLSGTTLTFDNPPPAAEILVRHLGAAAPSGASFQLKVSSDDTTEAYLEDKIVAGSGISVATLNGGSNETVQVTSTFTQLADDTTPQLGGDLDLNGNQITSSDGTDLIDIPNGSIDLQTNSVSRADITDTGIRLGGANARVTTILDEDNMASDSPTALATQQSIKAYVDASAGGGGIGAVISTVTISSDATVEFTGLDGTYDKYVLYLSNIHMTTNDTSLNFEMGTGATPTWQTTSGDYAYTGYVSTDGGALSPGGIGTAASIRLLSDIGSGTGEGAMGTYYIENLASTDNHKKIIGHGSKSRAAVGSITIQHVAGELDNATTAVTGIRIVASSSTIASGKVTLVGINDA